MHIGDWKTMSWSKVSYIKRPNKSSLSYSLC